MSALFFLLGMLAVLWLAVWMFQAPAASPSRRGSPFDYVEIDPPPSATHPTTSGAGWRQRRAQSKSRL